MSERYERKFLIKDMSFEEVDLIIKRNYFNFQKRFSDRYVNNIYFDNYNLDNFKDNIEGNTNRKKVRIRWYGSHTGRINNPKLEVKIKKGEIGYKEVINLKPFEFNSNYNINTDILRRELRGISKSSIIDNLYPTLVNRYKRRYYESFNRKFRITLDKKLEYFSFINGNISLFQNYKDNLSIVLELKYSLEAAKSANKVSNQFPFRITKSSKYVNGIEQIKPYDF